MTKHRTDDMNKTVTDHKQQPRSITNTVYYRRLLLARISIYAKVTCSEFEINVQKSIRKMTAQNRNMNDVITLSATDQCKFLHKTVKYLINIT